MRIAIHQPNCLPNLAYFYKMASADLFVVVTNLQFEKLEGWQRRNKIRGAHGDIWLTVPITGSRTQKIRDVRIDNASDWRSRHPKCIRHSYGSTRELDALEALTRLYDREWDRLADFNLATIFLIREMLGITTPVVVDEEVTGVKHDLILRVCRKYGATSYLSGLGAQCYSNAAALRTFAEEGVGHEYVDWDFSIGYPYSALHYLLTEGVADTRGLLGVQSFGLPQPALAFAA